MRLNQRCGNRGNREWAPGVSSACSVLTDSSGLRSSAPEVSPKSSSLAVNVNQNVIENVVEPVRLLLVWQGPEGSSRTRHVVGELTSEPSGEVTLRYSSDPSVLEPAKKDGFIGYAAFRDLSKVYTAGVADAFFRRIPPRSRGDFN